MYITTIRFPLDSFVSVNKNPSSYAGRYLLRTLFALKIWIWSCLNTWMFSITQWYRGWRVRRRTDYNSFYDSANKVFQSLFQHHRPISLPYPRIHPCRKKFPPCVYLYNIFIYINICIMPPTKPGAVAFYIHTQRGKR